MRVIYIEESKCHSCGACTAQCNANALSLEKKHATVTLDSQRCTGCALCIKACPARAIAINNIYIG